MFAFFPFKQHAVLVVVLATFTNSKFVRVCAVLEPGGVEPLDCSRIHAAAIRPHVCGVQLFNSGSGRHHFVVRLRGSEVVAEEDKRA